MASEVAAASEICETLENWIAEEQRDALERLEARPSHVATCAKYGRVAFADFPSVSGFDEDLLIRDAIDIVTPLFVGAPPESLADGGYDVRTSVATLLEETGLNIASSARAILRAHIDAFLEARSALVFSVADLLCEAPLKTIITQELERKKEARRLSESRDRAAKRRRLERKLRKLDEL